MAARAVVADGIVAQILRQFAQLVAAAAHGGGSGIVLQRHVGPAGVDRHVLGRLLDQRGQIHRGHLSHRLAAVAGLGAVQLTQLQNVADQRDHPLCLLVDARGEGRHVGGLCHAGLDQLGIAGNARQRGFQLVADVGRELAAHRLVVLAQLAVRLDRPRQRDQFLIRHIGLNRVQMLGQMVDRLHHAAGQPPAEQRGSKQNQHDCAAQQRQGVGAQAPDVRDVLAHAQHLCALRQVDAHGVVVRLQLQRLALAGDARGTVRHCLLKFRAVCVVGQVGLGRVDVAVYVHDVGTELGVVQHRAVCVDEGDAQGAVLRQQVQQRGSAVGVLCLVGCGVAMADLHQVIVNAFCVAVLKKHRRRRQHGQRAEQSGQDQAAPVAAGHAEGLARAAFVVSHHCPPCSACSPPCARCGWPRPPRRASGAASGRACRWCGIPVNRRCPRRPS